MTTRDRISAAGSGPETWQLVIDLRAERDSILTELADRQAAYRGATLRVAEAEERAEKAEALHRIAVNKAIEQSDARRIERARIQELETENTRLREAQREARVYAVRLREAFGDEPFGGELTNVLVEALAEDEA